MKVFLHHIYEFRKGLRNLVMFTDSCSMQEQIEQRLKRGNIAYVIQPVRDRKINVFFGNPVCVDVIRQFADKPLNMLTPEEDFILGIMLGYDRLQQCMRFLKRAKSASGVYSICNSEKVAKIGEAYRDA